MLFFTIFIRLLLAEYIMADLYVGIWNVRYLYL